MFHVIILCEGHYAPSVTAKQPTLPLGAGQVCVSLHEAEVKWILNASTQLNLCRLRLL